MSYVASMSLLPGVLAGETRAIARLLTRAEAGAAEAREALDAAYAAAGRAHVVGITGVPGSGKSTLVAKLVADIRRTGRRVAVVAVDPSSPYSGGAILGDRIRMAEVAGDPGVFVRSMATRGALGGLAHGTLEAVDVLDAAGFEVVLIETVGVGQDEVDVARAAHTTVVVSAPGLGDDIQAIKAGILEIADVHVVSKCDRPESDRAIADLRNMLALDLATSRRPLWRVPVLPVASLRDEGIGALREAIDRHREALDAEGGLLARRREIARRRLVKAGEDILRERFSREGEERIAALLQDLVERRASPRAAARALLDELAEGGTR
ncbi:MAG: methylmalonyl Co-A mutase-associated GTPase MeaB [Betaproteobacteria bacterium]|nr:methylmalonyl Co-A mutase-associated GTPase MeaB [Betaproteobacteria bacterium]MDH5286192.1 methylmalonyl Co-A mutase-associated GTPase MeaB [Betaproteobacteria bacterium]